PRAEEAMLFPRLQTTSCCFNQLSLGPRQTQPGRWRGVGTVVVCFVVAGMGTAVMDYGLRLSDPANATAPLCTTPPPRRPEIANKILENGRRWVVGTTALDFTLPDALTGQKVHLRELLSQKPVVLLFGSFG